VQATELLDRHRDLWVAATRHPFLAAVGAATIEVAAFDRWLVQDYRFVSGLLTFQARLLGRAPRPAQAALLSGTAALADELGWFEVQAARRGLDLTAPALAPTLDYLALLEQFDLAPYPVAVVALWALERVYFEAWDSASPSAEPYRDVVEHWTVPAFAAYLAALECLADEALADGGNGQAESAFQQVLLQESAFWDMALAAASPA
jgi:thiaminase/transcriptional activator TenA